MGRAVERVQCSYSHTLLAKVSVLVNYSKLLNHQAGLGSQPSNPNCTASAALGQSARPTKEVILLSPDRNYETRLPIQV